MRDKIRKYLKFFTVFAGISVVLSYALYEVKDIMIGPVIEIKEPKNGHSYYEGVIEVVGQAKNTASLSLNGRPIKMDDSGNFSEKITLAEGYNITTIEAKDRVGTPKEEKIKIMYLKPVATTTETEEKEEKIITSEGETSITQ